MTRKELNTRAEEIGIPYNFGLFKRPVNPPHLVAHYEENDNFGADNKVYYNNENIRLELTTEQEDERLEKEIEDKILYDIYYNKKVTNIETEEIINVSYFFQIN